VDGEVAATTNPGTTTAAVTLGLGAHSLVVRAIDSTGRVGTSVVTTVTVEVTPPTVTAPVVKLLAGAAVDSQPVTITASATDASRVCLITATANGTTVGTAKSGTLNVSTTLPRTGGPAVVAVTATDCAGNVATATGSFTLTTKAESAGQYSGVWTSPASASYADGAAKATSAAGAEVSWTFTGTQVAWIGSRSTTSGVATVYIDGVKVATVDTRGGTTLHRQALWVGTTTTGAHTIKVVNVATLGRPNLLVDGFVSLG
jgi:hypothetical protein